MRMDLSTLVQVDVRYFASVVIRVKKIGVHNSTQFIATVSIACCVVRLN
jgi:hypothetical protein